jgi:hypothetical protein
MSLEGCEVVGWPMQDLSRWEDDASALEMDGVGGSDAQERWCGGAGTRALRDVIGFGYGTAEVPVDVSGIFVGANTMTLDVQGL